MKSPALTVDVVIEFPDGAILFVKRGNEPFRSQWALPGGFVEYGEVVEQAAVREAKEETNLDIRLDGLIGVYSDPQRDPRGHTVSIVFRATPVGGEPKAASDAAEVLITKDYQELELAFDHRTIVSDATRRPRGSS
jgi:8-oxo-dGTP diphosphatase